MSEHLDNPLPTAATEEARRLRGELNAARAELAKARETAPAKMRVEVERAEADRLTTHRLLNEALADMERLKSEIEGRDHRIEALQERILALESTPRVTRRLYNPDQSRIAVSVQLLALAAPEDLEPVVRAVARLLREGGTT